jgi:hypothetical protein
MTEVAVEMSWKDRYKAIYDQEMADKQEAERLRLQALVDKFSKMLSEIVGHEVVATSDVHEMDGVKFKLNTENPEELKIWVNRQCRSCFEQTDLPVETQNDLAFAIFAPDAAICTCAGSKFQKPDGQPAVTPRKGGH